MKIKHNKLLHYVLIILLVLAPVRSVMAMQQMNCDMDSSKMPISMAMTASDVSVSKIHASHDMSSMTQNDANQHSCCDQGDSCISNCDMGVSVSLFIQTSAYSPLLLNVAEAENISSAPIIRELTPPSRPPLKLS